MGEVGEVGEVGEAGGVGEIIADDSIVAPAATWRGTRDDSSVISVIAVRRAPFMRGDSAAAAPVASRNRRVDRRGEGRGVGGGGGREGAPCPAGTWSRRE